MTLCSKQSSNNNKIWKTKLICDEISCKDNAINTITTFDASQWWVWFSSYKFVFSLCTTTVAWELGQWLLNLSDYMNSYNCFFLLLPPQFRISSQVRSISNSFITSSVTNAWFLSIVLVFINTNVAEICLSWNIFQCFISWFCWFFYTICTTEFVTCCLDSVKTQNFWRTNLSPKWK